LQSSHLSVIQGLKFFSIHDGGTFTHAPLWLRPCPPIPVSATV